MNEKDIKESDLGEDKTDKLIKDRSHFRKTFFSNLSIVGIEHKPCVT